VDHFWIAASFRMRILSEFIEEEEYFICTLHNITLQNVFQIVLTQVAQAQHLYKRMYGYYSMVDFQRKY